MPKLGTNCFNAASALAVATAGAALTLSAQAPPAEAKGVFSVERPAGTAAFDATKSFDEAIQSLGRGGGTIRIQTPGTYLISSTLVFDGSLAVRIDCDAGASRAANDHQTIDLIYTGKSGSLIRALSSKAFEIAHCNLAYSDPDYDGDLIVLDAAPGKPDTSHAYLHDNRIGGLSTTKAKASSLVHLNHSNQIVLERNFFISATTGILGPSESVRVEGLEKLDPRGAYVFVANHGSFLDIPALLASL